MDREQREIRIGSSLKWTVLHQSEWSVIKLNGQNDWNWSVMYQTGRSKRIISATGFWGLGPDMDKRVFLKESWVVRILCLLKITCIYHHVTMTSFKDFVFANSRTPRIWPSICIIYNRLLWEFETVHLYLSINPDRTLWLERPSNIVLDRPLWLKWPFSLAQDRLLLDNLNIGQFNLRSTNKIYNFDRSKTNVLTAHLS